MKLQAKFFLFLFSILLNFFSIAQNLNWVKQFEEVYSGLGGTYYEQYMNGFKFTDQKEIITYGLFEGAGDVDFDPNAGEAIHSGFGSRGGYIVKLDSLGELDWVRRTTGEVLDLDIDEAGNIYATGIVGLGYVDMFVLKLNSDGDKIWTQNYGSALEYDYGYEISVLEGKVYLAGIFGGEVNLDPNFTDTLFKPTSQKHFVMCIDTNTQYNWMHDFSANGYEGIVLDHNNIGELFYGYNTSQAYLKKYDMFGTELMNVDWGSGNSLQFEEISFDQDGGIYLAGRAEAATDIDPGSGQKLVNGIFYLRLDSNGNFYNGNGLLAASWNGYVISAANGIDVDYQKNVYISGSFMGDIDADPNPYTSKKLIGQTFSMDAFVAKYDSLGNYLWAYDLGDVKFDFSKHVYVDDKLNVTSCGGFDCTVDFDPGLANNNLTALGCYEWMEDSYIQQIKQDTCSHLGLVVDSISEFNCMDLAYVSCHGINSQGPYLYSWDGGAFSSNSEFYSSIYGGHEVSVKDDNGCMTSRIVELIPIYSVETGLQVWDTEITSNAIGASYQWLDCLNGFSAISGETSQNFIATSTGEYAVQISQNGCTDTSSCVMISIVSLDENDLLDQMIINPNPTNGRFQINFGEYYEFVELKITDLQGREIRHEEIRNKNGHEINLIEPAGIYFVTINVQDRKSKVIKLLKN